MKDKTLNIGSIIFFGYAIIIFFIFISSLIFGFLNPFFNDSSHRVGQGADFYAFYQAGYNVIRGLSPYDENSKYFVVPYFYKYRYLPFFAYTFGIMFNIFPYQVAYWIWVIVLIIFICYTCLITNKICILLKTPQWVRTIAIGMWLCFSPIYIELYMGQITLFVGLLTFYSCYAEYKKKSRLEQFFGPRGLL